MLFRNYFIDEIQIQFVVLWLWMVISGFTTPISLLLINAKVRDVRVVIVRMVRTWIARMGMRLLFVMELNKEEKRMHSMHSLFCLPSEAGKPVRLKET
jgi:hypothetical protein